MKEVKAFLGLNGQVYADLDRCLAADLDYNLTQIIGASDINPSDSYALKRGLIELLKTGTITFSTQINSGQHWLEAEDNLLLLEYTVFLRQQAARHGRSARAVHDHIKDCLKKHLRRSKEHFKFDE